MAKAYSKQMDENNILLLREILSELPQYVTITFRGIENTTSTRTRLGYARDIKIFYEFLCEHNVEYGDSLTERQKKYHEKNKVRDLALLSLMLSTGMRVSECVGIDIHDIDFDNMRIKIIRKGGKEAFVYFSDEASEALIKYLEERKKLVPESGHENALFLSSQLIRISVRSVENIVKKYSLTSVPLKHITPHKLRSTFGTELYRATDDIYLVADVLGHSDVNTTRKHYADMDEDRKRRFRNEVQLREKRPVVNEDLDRARTSLNVQSETNQEKTDHKKQE